MKQNWKFQTSKMKLSSIQTKTTCITVCYKMCVQKNTNLIVSFGSFLYFNLLVKSQFYQDSKLCLGVRECDGWFVSLSLMDPCLSHRHCQVLVTRKRESDKENGWMFTVVCYDVTIYTANTDSVELNIFFLEGVAFDL